MATEDMARELERLRADVAALQAARRESEVANAQAPPQASPDTVSGVDTEQTGEQQSSEPGLSETMMSELEELGELLQEELKNMPAVTSLAVFTLGILLGRFLR